MFPYNGGNRPESKTTRMFRPVRRMAAPVRRQTTFFFGRDRRLNFVDWLIDLFIYWSVSMLFDGRWWWIQDECLNSAFTMSAGPLVTATVPCCRSIHVTRTCVITDNVFATSTRRWTAITNVSTTSWPHRVALLSFDEGHGRPSTLSWNAVESTDSATSCGVNASLTLGDMPCKRTSAETDIQMLSYLESPRQWY